MALKRVPKKMKMKMDGIEEDVDANMDDEDEGEHSTIVATSHDPE